MVSQVILHPTLSHALKYGGTTVGRDKAYRAAQFFAQFYAWHLSTKGDKDEAGRWVALRTHLAIARKLLSLGKPIEHLQAALRAVLANGPIGEQITAIARQLSYFVYLTYDAVIWANAIKFIRLKPETVQRIQKISVQFWLAGILSSIVNGVLKTARLAKEVKHLEASKTRGEKDLAEDAAREIKLNAIKASRVATRRQLTIDWLDVWLPAASMGLVNANEGTLSILGLISSLIGVKAQWASVASK
ncbi:hypothetical protein AX15_007180 [Amanita polypyramis BW_CC]|nr:hypothetical protein AX15_007180 [Amanita polypyramis BW_CC]